MGEYQFAHAPEILKSQIDNFVNTQNIKDFRLLWRAIQGNFDSVSGQVLTFVGICNTNKICWDVRFKGVVPTAIGYISEKGAGYIGLQKDVNLNDIPIKRNDKTYNLEDAQKRYATVLENLSAYQNARESAEV